MAFFIQFRLLTEIIDCSLRAGEEILKIYESKKLGVEYKSDQSPVTLADMASHHIIQKSLLKHFPGIPHICEEGSIAPFEERKKWKSFFLIDPLDGTKEFIKGNGEFTVNIALIEDGHPICSVIYAPALDQLFYAKLGQGTYERFKGIEDKIHVSDFSEPSAPFKMIQSRSHLDSSQTEMIKTLKKNHKIEAVQVGSSLKFGILAKGEAHLYFRKSCLREWDTAAVQLIVLESGGGMIDLNTGIPPRLNKSDLIVPDFFAWSKNVKIAELMIEGVL
jgi:3'(2'), 5'-bisphosphate nucleotidase